MNRAKKKQISYGVSIEIQNLNFIKKKAGKFRPLIQIFEN
jgi:hypothetical protein